MMVAAARGALFIVGKKTLLLRHAARVSLSTMHISPEGKIGIALTLLFGFGGGAVMLFPTQSWIGAAIMAVSVFGAILLAFHHFGFPRGNVARIVSVVCVAAVIMLGASWYIWRDYISKTTVIIVVDSVNIIQIPPDSVDLIAFVKVDSNSNGVFLRNWSLKYILESGSTKELPAIPIIETRTWNIHGEILTIEPQASLVGKTEIMYNRGYTYGRILFRDHSVDYDKIKNESTTLILTCVNDSLMLQSQPKTLLEIKKGSK